MRFLAIDPGKDKCGLAILEDRRVLEKKVISPQALYLSLMATLEEYKIEKIILGDRTFAQKTKKEILKETKEKWAGEIVLVDEHLSTQEARAKYFAENPPKGLKRLIPLTLQSPPEAYDHYVALILAERYLDRLEE